MKLIREPRRQEALAQMFPGRKYFRSDSFDLALNGTERTRFKDILMSTRHFRARLSIFMPCHELQLGNYTQAIEYLKKYNSGDEIIQARAYCNIGDAYAGLNDLDNALSWYKKAALYKDNAYSAAYYKKAGIILEEKEDYSGALEMYKTIKDQYPQTNEGVEIDKYISRLEILMEQ